MRVNELLDWLGSRLQLEWVSAVPAVLPAPEPAQAIDGALPDAEQLRALDELVSLGYFRGIVRKLDDIEASDPAQAAFVGRLRVMAQNFQLDAMTRVIRHALGAQQAST